jgi:hypothetical protein
MQPAKGNGAAYLSDLRRLIADENLAIAILAAVAVAAMFAFALGATSDIIILMLVVGGVTAWAEAKLRATK